jgi:excisionase family DNA binding protein
MDKTHNEVTELLDTNGVASLFGCSPRTVQRAVANRALPFVKIPGSRLVRFRPSAIAEAWKKFEVFRNYRSPFDDGPGAAGAIAA